MKKRVIACVAATYSAILFAAPVANISNAYAEGQSFNLDCPTKSEIIKQFSAVKGKPFPDTRLEDLYFEDFQVWTKWFPDDVSIAENAYADLRSTPVAKYQEYLKLSLDDIPVVAVLNSKTYPYSYISCRYKIQNADPGYVASSTYTALFDAGLTRPDDSYINFETMIFNTICQPVSGSRITCAEKSKSYVTSPQIENQEGASRTTMTVVKKHN